MLLISIWLDFRSVLSCCTKYHDLCNIIRTKNAENKNIIFVEKKILLIGKNKSMRERER